MVLQRRLALAPGRSWLVLGPRRVGKSTYLRQRYPAQRPQAAAAESDERGGAAEDRANDPPLTFEETPGFELDARLQNGCLRPVVLSDDPWGDLRGYCGEYLREEVHSEGLVRNVAAFSRFLELAALGNAELVSYAPIARENLGSGDRLRDTKSIC